jgi:hypothetical protein
MGNIDEDAEVVHPLDGQNAELRQRPPDQG